MKNKLKQLMILEKVLLIVLVLLFTLSYIYADKIYETITIGKEYKRGDNVTISVGLENSSGNPVVGSNITATVYFPNQTLLTNLTFSQLANGLYINITTLPSNAPFGDYFVRVSSNQFFGFSSFQVKPIEEFASKINDTAGIINQSTFTILTNINNQTRAILSDFGEVAAGSQYLAKLSVFDFIGAPKDPLVTPTATLLDPLQNVIVDHVSMTKDSTGIYSYNFTTSASQTDGEWETLVNVTTEKGSFDLSDYWELESSPAEVRINSIPDNTVRTITADVTITNEGSGDQEYQIEYCIVTQQSNSCGGNDDTDYATSAKLIQAGKSFNTQLTLRVPTIGDYFFKVIVYFGTEKSGASKSFTAVNEVIVTAPATKEKKGGGQPKDIIGLSKVAIGVIEDIGLLTTNFLHRIIPKSNANPSGIAFRIEWDGSQHQILLRDINIREDNVELGISSAPFRFNMNTNEKRRFDITDDGKDDIEVFIRTILADDIILGVRSLESKAIETKEGVIGKIQILDYPIIVSNNHESKEESLKIKNIGAGDLTNVKLEILGLPLDTYRIVPDKYDLISPEEIKVFRIILEPNIINEINKIKFIVTSNEGYEEAGSILVIRQKQIINLILVLIIIFLLIYYFRLKELISVDYQNKFLTLKNILIAIPLGLFSISFIYNMTISEILLNLIGYLTNSLNNVKDYSFVWLVLFVILFYLLYLEIKKLNSYISRSTIAPRSVYGGNMGDIPSKQFDQESNTEQTVPKYEYIQKSVKEPIHYYTPEDYRDNVYKMLKEDHSIYVDGKEEQQSSNYSPQYDSNNENETNIQAIDDDGYLILKPSKTYRNDNKNEFLNKLKELHD